MEQKKNKKKGLVIGLVLCLALVGVAGVMAWYASESSITNTFSTGNIKPPTTDPDQPTKPIDPNNPDKPVKPEHGVLDGNIYEKSWVPDSVIAPGSAVAKDPNIGLAPQSDDAYVFVYVKNNLGTGTYFELKNNWKAVSDQGVEKADKYNNEANKYTGGLFMYTKDGQNPELLVADKKSKAEGGKDAWTGTVFDNVHAAPSASITQQDPTMQVSCFMIAKSSSEENLTPGDAKTQAIAWANHPNGPTVK